MQQHLRRVAVALSLATSSAVAWAVIAGTGVADAATRYRSGAVHAQLLDSASRIAPNAPTSSGLGLTGSDVMASLVGLMAVLAFAFLVVTFFRRRTRLAA